MNKSRIDNLEKQVRQKTGHNDYPAPAFFTKKPDVEKQIEDWRIDLLKQGYSLEAVNLTPAYIEE